MNKTKSKVLSLVLASAMIVSSFSSLNFASAATRTENGTVSVDNEDIYLVSSLAGDSAEVDILNLIGSTTVKTYDREEAGAGEVVKISHVKGDKLLKFEDDGKIILRKGASGQETISVRFEEEYDRDDNDVTVKASKDITVYADVNGAPFVAEAGKAAGSAETERPDAIGTAALNEAYLDAGLYVAQPSASTSDPAIVAEYDKYDITAATKLVNNVPGASLYLNDVKYAEVSGFYIAATTAPSTDVSANTTSISAGSKFRDLTSAEVADSKKIYFNTVADATSGWEDVTTATTSVSGKILVSKEINGTNIELKGTKAFTGFALKGQTKLVNTSGVYTVEAIANAPTDENVIRLFTKYEQAVGTKKEQLGKASNDTLKIKLPKMEYVSTSTSPEKVDITGVDSSTTDIKVVSEKKWNADAVNGVDAGATTKWEINKVKGTTYLAASGIDWDSKNWSDNKDNATSIGSYDKIVANGEVVVLGGSVKAIDAGSISVEDGSTGDLTADTSVYVEAGSVGAIEVDEDYVGNVTIDSGKADSIYAKKSLIEINGGSISGNVDGDIVKIDAEDDDVNTVIGGTVRARGEDDGEGVTIAASGDATVTVKGTIRGAVTLSDANVTVGTIDADYLNDVTFTDFTGSVKNLVNANKEVILEDESKVSLGGKLTAETVSVEEDSKLTVEEANVGSIDGEGTFAFPAGKLHVQDGIDDSTKLVVSQGLAAGTTAFTSDEGAVDGEDLNTIGFTVETKSASKTTDKHVIKTVKFAGVQFDKTALTIVKGQSDTITVSNYPTGTALPAGYSVEWDVDVNDDYISVTTEGNVATIKALDYSTERSIDNQGKITATVVDEDGYEVEDLLEASIDVTLIEKPVSVVTLDTTKPVTVGTGAVYQYLANSSTKAVMTATSSDTQVATVELFNAADARGYKFQVKGVAEGTATITTTDANGATATLTVNVVKVNGTLKADTTTYTFAPGKVYDVKFSTTGTTAVPVVTVNGKVVSIAPRGNGVYRVTAQNAGTAYVVATVGNTHVSVKFVVAAGAASAGVTGNNVSNLK